MLFSAVAVVRLIVGRLKVGICGEGGRNEVGICCGASSLDVCSAVLGVLGEFVKGMENRGLPNFSLLSFTSLVSIRIGSFSDKISVVVVEESGEEGVNGLKVRSGMVLVLLKDYN